MGVRFACWQMSCLKLYYVKPCGVSEFSVRLIWALLDLQVAQVLLTLPYSFSQLGMVSGIVFQIFYGILGSWTAYLISVLYVEYRTRKEKENVRFKNHVIQVIILIPLKPLLPLDLVSGLGLLPTYSYFLATPSKSECGLIS
jgi:hypothetical protein